MKKKKTLISILLLFLLVSGFGCKGLSSEEQQAIKPVRLNYWTVYNDLGMLRKFADEYQRQRPYVRINIRKVREEEFDDLFVNALADDVSPDIISINSRDINKYRSRITTVPDSVTVANVSVSDSYTKETVVTTETTNMITPRALKSNFVSVVYDDVVQDDQIYGLPLALDTMALYYNKGLLDSVGIPVAPENWEDFMESIKESARFDSNGDITQAGVALGTGKNISRSFDILSLLMIQSGVKMSQGSAITFASGLSSNNENHPTLSAMRFYTDFARPTKEIYTWNEDMPDALESFVSNKSVFYFGFAYDYPIIKARAPQMELEVVPVPQLSPNEPKNIANYFVESVVKKSKNQDEAWDFIRFMTTPEKIAEYTTGARRPTPLRTQIEEQSQDIILQPFVSNILQAENWYHGSDKESAEDAFDQMIGEYLGPYSGTKSDTQRKIEIIQYGASRVQQSY